METEIGVPSLFIDAEPRDNSILDDVLTGLGSSPRRLPPKLFYDARGSRLFDAICELDAYYPTRTEMGIMQEHAADMARLIGQGAALVEYGSGSSIKTEILLSSLISPTAYLPIDISREHLLQSAERIARAHTSLRVLPVCADYTRDIPGLAAYAHRQKTVVYFPGSTIGNFEPDQAGGFLKRVAAVVGPGGGLLIGVDLRKNPARLVAAYDDDRGVTAAFNLNMLRHINARLGPVFDLEAFRHRAVWNADAGRIEMHLVSTEGHCVTVGGRRFEFAPGDAIVTEHSYKYTVEGFLEMSSRAGFTSERVWTDRERLFSVHYLTAR